MTPFLTNEEQEIVGAVKYQPAVSVMMPFEPKMQSKGELEHQLKVTCQQVEKELADSYAADLVKPVMAKLRKLIGSLDYSTHKKSLAFFVSPIVEKLFYLDIPIEKKVTIDESFEIRDLVYSKKEIHKYLLLVLSGHRSSVFLGNTTLFVRIAVNMPEHIAAYINDAPERVGNFSDPSDRKEVLLEKFLHHIDNSLGHLLNAYRLPLFIMGTDRTIGHFKKLSHNLGYVIGYIPGNYENATETEIRQAVAPYVADWKKVKQGDLLHQLDAANGAHKLVTGINEVWKDATQKKGRLLIVEKNYVHVARLGADEKIINTEDINISGNHLYIKDAVDDIIEKVLENGGDVEFVDEGLLNGYNKIALIKFY
jgi:Bacterial archaeo-eukaryotic release factor family 3